MDQPKIDIIGNASLVIGTTTEGLAGSLMTARRLHTPCPIIACGLSIPPMTCIALMTQCEPLGVSSAKSHGKSYRGPSLSG